MIKTDPITLEVMRNAFQSVAEEMGITLERTAYSPNIKERLDFSCAVFMGDAAMLAQAAHIPVHLGSMAYAMRSVVADRDWHPGDMLILNDPYLGGTHLPDVTLIAPVHLESELVGFVADRAHHADVGRGAQR